MQLLLIITGACLILSIIGDRKKTVLGLKKGAMMFLKILPTILTVIIVVSILLYLVPEQKIAEWFGAYSE